MFVEADHNCILPTLARAVLRLGTAGGTVHNIMTIDIKQDDTRL